jgi:glycosyltransferase involved in cell wall biosynthesis
MHDEIPEKVARPWASFCMSTYKRPDLLGKQLSLLLNQTFTNFEIVISDNDPEGSAQNIIIEINDTRIKYFQNGNNIGMIGSFNKTIERSKGEFVVMVTDDDPIAPEFLSEMNDLVIQDKRFALYGGFLFSGRRGYGDKVVIPAETFIEEILDPSNTTWMLWSSCMIRREKLLIDKIPEYGSPHLADHAMIALAGSHGGGLFLNKKFSNLTSHESNFSKFNFESYVQGCQGFYNAFTAIRDSAKLKTVRKHLHYWFIANIFNLKRYYTVSVPDARMLAEVNKCTKQILEFDFMQAIKLRYAMKNIIFECKKMFGLLKKKMD